HAVDLTLDALPDLGVGLDRLDHQVQLAEAALPHPHQAAEAVVDVEQDIGPRALVSLERAEHVFGGERAEIVVVHDVRHCSTWNRLLRRELLSRLAGVSSLTASCSRLKAP